MQSDIINRINKLRSLSNSSNANEAANAAKIANRLCEQHRISEADLNKNDSTITRDLSYIYETGRVTRWKEDLCCFLAQNYGCSILSEPEKAFNPLKRKSRKVSRYRLFGMKSDMEIVHYMFEWLSSEVERITILNCKGLGHVPSNSYSIGMVDGICVQIKKAKEEVRAEAEASQIQSLVKIDARAEESRKQMYMLNPGLVTVKTNQKNQIDSDSYYSGLEEGKSLQIKKALND